MNAPLPDFPYHPDPVRTGSVQASDATCLSCGRQRGHIYVGPVFAADEYDEAICPWCIADGSAAERFGAEFTDVGVVAPEDVADDGVLRTIATRTPGFTGWQQEHWMFHCGDGAAFLGRAGAEELRDHPDAVEFLRHEHDRYGWPAEEVEEYLAALDKDGQPTAYLFRCRHCGTHIAYSDFT